MTINVGTYSLADLRSARFASNYISELDFSKLNNALQADLRFWESQVQEAISMFAETSTDRARVWGSSAVSEFEKLGEFSQPSGQRYLQGNTSNFPLDRYGIALGWSSLWFQTHKAPELVEKVLSMQRGHNELVIKLMKEAIYKSENATVRDLLTDKTELSIKRWINADSSLIPNSPSSGSAFSGDVHTHFLTTSGSGVLASDDLNSLVDTVREHGVGTPVLIINEGNVSEVAALDGFTPLSAPVIQYAATDSTIQRLDIDSDPANRFIGYWGDNYTKVYTRPFAIEDYYLCMAVNGAEKPLLRRISPIAQLQGLHLEAENENFPLHARNYAVIEGWGVWNRLAGAVLTKDEEYSDPV